MHRDRLWDANGVVWTRTIGPWVTEDDVDGLLAAGAPVVVHGFERPFRTLTAEEARRFWSSARYHFQRPGDPTKPDAEGLTYAAHVWTRGEDRLLGFVEVSDPLSPAVAAFARSHISSLLQLEALLLIFEAGRQPRSASDLSAQMYVPEKAIEDWLASFAQNGFCERTADGYRVPDSAETYGLLAAVADCYVRRPISLGRLIFGRASSSPSAFADAFRLRKDH